MILYDVLSITVVVEVTMTIIMTMAIGGGCGDSYDSCDGNDHDGGGGDHDGNRFEIC